MSWSKTLTAAALCAALAGCGFQLRGQASLPFDTLYVPGASPLVVELKRNLVAGTHSKLVNSEKDAKAILGFTSEVREKVVLSFNTSGLVREYQLRYRVGFRLYDAKGRNYLPPNEIQLTRDVSFNEAQVLAKETEDALLYRDMQTDMVQQIIRRIVAAATSRCSRSKRPMPSAPAPVPRATPSGSCYWPIAASNGANSAPPAPACRCSETGG